MLGLRKGMEEVDRKDSNGDECFKDWFERLDGGNRLRMWCYADVGSM